MLYRCIYNSIYKGIASVLLDIGKARNWMQPQVTQTKNAKETKDWSKEKGQDCKYNKTKQKSKY